MQAFSGGANALGGSRLRDINDHQRQIVNLDNPEADLYVNPGSVEEANAIELINRQVEVFDRDMAEIIANGPDLMKDRKAFLKNAQSASRKHAKLMMLAVAVPWHDGVNKQKLVQSAAMAATMFTLSKSFRQEFKGMLREHRFGRLEQKVYQDRLNGDMSGSAMSRNMRYLKMRDAIDAGEMPASARSTAIIEIGVARQAYYRMANAESVEEVDIVKGEYEASIRSLRENAKSSGVSVKNIEKQKALVIGHLAEHDGDWAKIFQQVSDGTYLKEKAKVSYVQDGQVQVKEIMWDGDFVDPNGEKIDNPIFTPALPPWYKGAKEGRDRISVLEMQHEVFNNNLINKLDFNNSDSDIEKFSSIARGYLSGLSVGAHEEEGEFTGLATSNKSLDDFIDEYADDRSFIVGRGLSNQLKDLGVENRDIAVYGITNVLSAIETEYGYSIEAVKNYSQQLQKAISGVKLNQEEFDREHMHHTEELARATEIYDQCVPQLAMLSREYLLEGEGLELSDHGAVQEVIYAINGHGTYYDPQVGRYRERSGAPIGVRDEVRAMFAEDNHSFYMVNDPVDAREIPLREKESGVRYDENGEVIGYSSASGEKDVEDYIAPESNYEKEYHSMVKDPDYVPNIYDESPERVFVDLVAEPGSYEIMDEKDAWEYDREKARMLAAVDDLAMDVSIDVNNPHAPIESLLNEKLANVRFKDKEADKDLGLGR